MILFILTSCFIVASNIWDAAETAKKRGYDVTGIESAQLDDLNHFEEVATIESGIAKHYFTWNNKKYIYKFTYRSGCEERRYEPFIIT